MSLHYEIMDSNAEVQRWQQLAQQVLAIAKSQGATAAEVSVSAGTGLGVSVRLGKVETIEYNREQGLGVTIFMGQSKGSASTADMSPEALTATVAAATAIAKVTSPDPYAGLADPQLLAYNYPDLDLYHPWQLTAEQAIAMAIECEELARGYDQRIVNSDGAALSSHQGVSLYANSHGFMGCYPTTRHSMSCALIAQQDLQMQTDYSYTIARAKEDLDSPAQVAKRAGERTVRKLGAQRIKTCQVPVIFEASCAKSLLNHFISAISGGNLYRQTSFLLNKLDEVVFAPIVRLREQPHLLRALGSSPYDSEGVATQPRDLVNAGVLQAYVLGSYSARKLGMTSTGNADGIHNLTIDSGQYDLTALLKMMGTGLLVTELMGQGVNILTGDYSRGAAGFWVEAGEIQYPVEEITVAGNLRDMFMRILAIGNDVDMRTTIQTGSILIDKLTIGGV